MKKISNAFKILIGLAVSGFFLYLAFRKVDLQNLGDVLKNTKIPLLIIAVFVLFISHWLRAVRHRYLIEPIKKIENGSLFSALMIGYMANTILPAHLGEVLRAYVIGKKEGISGSATFATIAVERIIDVLSLLIIMGLVLMVYPFPDAVKLSAYLTFAFVIILVGFLAFLKMKPKQAIVLVEIITKPLPVKISDKLVELLMLFKEGVVTLKDRHSYFVVFILSILIWVCYAGVFAVGFYAFDFIHLYNIPIGASFVVLVITTISVLVPSSPGYVGTYHWLCMVSLTLFAVPESPALGYAIVIHAISMIPVALVGVAFALKEGINISKVGKQSEMEKIVVLE